MDLKILIMTAVAAEQEAVLRGLNGDHRFDVVAGGVGQVLAAVSTTKALASTKYDFVISAGIGGGFKNNAEVGSIVVANEIVAADLGVETSEGFSRIEELGFGVSRFSIDMLVTNQLEEALLKIGLIVQQGPILTLSTVTGTEEKALELASRIPNAHVEAMEGFGVATAASQFQIPCLEIRAISNLVGPRDRSAWKIKEALEVLEKASSILPEVFK